MNKADTLRQGKKLRKLLEQQTRAEIMARFSRFDTLEFTDYFQIKLDKTDEMRELVFGTSNMIELGYKWGLLKRNKTKKQRKKKTKN